MCTLYLEWSYVEILVNYVFFSAFTGYDTKSVIFYKGKLDAFKLRIFQDVANNFIQENQSDL